MKTIAAKVLKGLTKTPPVWNKIIEEAVHFVLPEHGTLLGDQLKYLGTSLLLPYPTITITYVSRNIEYFIVAIQENDKILVTSFIGKDKLYSVHPIGIWVDRYRTDSESIVTSEVIANEEIFNHIKGKVSLEDMILDTLHSVYTVLGLLEALEFKNTLVEVDGATDLSVNKKRKSKKKQLLFASNVVSINVKTKLVKHVRNTIENRKPPEPHVRRAHHRKLRSGRIIEISTMKIKGGNVSKDYLIV